MSQKTFKERASLVRETLSSKERFADILHTFKIEVSRDFTFTLRDERTSSIAIYETGTCFDWGVGGKRMDIVDVVSLKEDIKAIEALVKVEDVLGIDNKGLVKYEFKAPVFTKSSKDGDYDDTPLSESYIRYFKEQLYKYKAKAELHLEKLLPNADSGQRLRAVSIFEIGYDPKNDKLTFPVRSAKGQILNMAKYTSCPGLDDDGKNIPKLKYLYGRRRVLFNLQILKTAPKVVYLLEGEKDVVNAHLSGLASITQGAASGWKSWMAESIVKTCEYYKVEIPKFIILQDNDKAGVISTLRIFHDLKEIQPDTKMMFWTKSPIANLSTLEKAKPFIKDMAVLKTNLEIIPKGFDYTDYKSIQQ